LSFIEKDLVLFSYFLFIFFRWSMSSRLFWVISWCTWEQGAILSPTASWGC